MRIAFWGKGGSGKTTVTASFITHLGDKLEGDESILAIDADSNVHLGQMLGFNALPTFLGPHFKDLARKLEGDNLLYKELGFDPIPDMGTVPPTRDTIFIRPQSNNRLLDAYIQTENKTQLVVVGPHEKEDETDSCYHVKLNSLELFLHRLLDREQDWVVADITAGVDTMGTSLVAAYDINVFVVEPTLKSVTVCKRWLELFSSMDQPPFVGVIANKIRDEKDLAFIKSHIDAPVITHLKHDANLRRYDQGDVAAFKNFVHENRGTWEQLVSIATNQQKDWLAYLSNLQHFYVERCKGWWDEYTSTPLSTTYDKDFSYRPQVSG